MRSFLSAAIILLSPGPFAWQAAAQTVSAVAGVPAAGGVSGAAASAPVSLRQGAALSLAPGLVPAVVPSALPTYMLGLDALQAGPLEAPSRVGALPSPDPLLPSVSLGSPSPTPVAGKAALAPAEGVYFPEGHALSRAPARMTSRPQAVADRHFRSLREFLGAKVDSLSIRIDAGTDEVLSSQGGGGVRAEPLRTESAASESLSSPRLVQSGSAAPEMSSLESGAPDPGTPAPAPKAGLGRVAIAFILGLVVAQIGVEALGASMPTLVQKQFGDFTAVAQLAIFSSITGIIGRQLAGLAIQRWGLKKTYLGASALRLVSISILAGLLATGYMTLPLMMVFYSLNGFLGGIAVTAETSIPAALLDPKMSEAQRQAALERFWTWEQTLLEVIGISGPIATGAIVASFGFLPALYAFPITFGIAIAWFLFTLKIPQENEPRLKAQAAAGASSAGGVFKDFWRKISHGARIVWANPVLRTVFLAYTVYMMLNPFLYSMFAPAYALRLIGPENAQAATAIMGWLTGLYSAGGLIGGLFMMAEQRRLRRGREDGTIDDAKEAEILRGSVLRWMLWGTAGLVMLLPLAFVLPTLGAWLTLPGLLSWAGSLTLPALTLMVFGIAQVVAQLKLRSLFQAKVEKQDMADAMGFLGSASLLVVTLGLLSLKLLFSGSIFGLTLFTAPAGLTPFYYIAASLIPLAFYYLSLRRRLSKLTAPKP